MYNGGLVDRTLNHGQTASWTLPGGSFTDVNHQTLTYTAEVYRDGPNANMTGDARFDIVIEKKTVTAADILPARLAPGGGMAVRFVPQGAATKKRK